MAGGGGGSGDKGQGTGVTPLPAPPGTPGEGHSRAGGTLTAQPQADGGPGLSGDRVVAAVVALVGQAGVGQGQPRGWGRAQDSVPSAPLSHTPRAWQQHLGAQGAVLGGAGAWGHVGTRWGHSRGRDTASGKVWAPQCHSQCPQTPNSGPGPPWAPQCHSQCHQPPTSGPVPPMSPDPPIPPSSIPPCPSSVPPCPQSLQCPHTSIPVTVPSLSQISSISYPSAPSLPSPAGSRSPQPPAQSPIPLSPLSPSPVPL